MGDLKNELKKWKSKTDIPLKPVPVDIHGQGQLKTPIQNAGGSSSSVDEAKNSEKMFAQKPAVLIKENIQRPRPVGWIRELIRKEQNEKIEFALKTIEQKRGSPSRPNSNPPKQAQMATLQSSPVPSIFTTLPKSELSRIGIYREPDDWVSFGASTQYRASQSGRNMDIVIGVDFGTAYTKVAVGMNDKIFPVTWEGVSKAAPSYLLPSEYSTRPDGTSVFGQHPAASMEDVHGDLKLPFINPGVSNASIARASVFLALVLRYSRAWVYRHHGGKIDSSRIRWQLNIGAPSNGLENDRLSAAYRRLAGSAWTLSVSPTNLLFAEVQDLVGDWTEQQPRRDLVDVPGIFPEFVAQMAGYMQSPQRVLGLHSLVDVGGGTLDIVTFNVHSVDDEDTFPFLVPDVRPLGTHGLLQNRFVDAPVPSHSHHLDELAPIQSPAAFSADTRIGLDHISTRDRLFSKEIGKVVKRVFETTKSKRYRLSDAWQTGVRTFFTGGGSNVALYGDAVKGAPVPSKGGLHLIPLPPHPKLDGFDHGTPEYQRISVACGLAQDSYTLGRIVPAREVEDDIPIGMRSTDKPDRDDIYSR